MRKIFCFSVFFCSLGFIKAQTDSVTVLVEIVTDYFPQECTFAVYSGLVETDPALYAFGPFVGTQGTMNTYILTLAQGCYTFKAMDSHGDGLGFTDGHIYVTYVNQDSSLVQLNGFYPSPFFATACLYLPQVSEQIPGCMDAEATNYNPLANVSDESCEYAYIFGCKDSIAENYNPLATMDDGSCEYIFGCMSQSACNFDSTATMNADCDFTSCHIYGCVDPSAFNFNEFATDPDFSSPPYWGCGYWIPDTILVEQYCGEFLFTVVAEDGSEMPVSADINNWSIGNDIYIENGGTILTASLNEGLYTVVFVYSQGQLFTSIQIDVNVVPLLNATLTQVGDTLFCDAPGATLYEFTVDGALLNQSTQNWMIPTQSGGYTCIATTPTGCQLETAVIPVTVNTMCSCLGDFDCNGNISVSDLIIFVAYWGCIANCDTDNDGLVDGDFDHDGVCNMPDLINFISRYGTLCP